MGTGVRTQLRQKDTGPSVRLYLAYLFGRALQVAGLVTGAVAMTAFFGTPSTTAMLRMTLAAVLLFVPGTIIVRSLPAEEGRRRTPGTRRGPSP